MLDCVYIGTIPISTCFKTQSCSSSLTVNGEVALRAGVHRHRHALSAHHYAMHPAPHCRGADLVDCGRHNRAAVEETGEGPGWEERWGSRGGCRTS